MSNTRPSPASVSVDASPQLLDAIDVIALILNRDGRIRFANRKAAGIASRRPAELKGLFVAAIPLLASSSANRLEENLDLMREARELRGEVERLLGQEEHWLRIDRIPLRAETGDVTGLLIIAYDETAFRLRQRSSSEALASVENRYRALLDACPDLIFRIHRDGTFLDYWAAASETLLAPHQIIGSNICDLLPEEVAATTARAMANTLSEGVISEFEYSLPSSEGARFFQVRLRRCGQDETIAYVRNITAGKHVERSRILQARLAEFRAGLHPASRTAASEAEMLRQAVRAAVHHLDAVAARIWLLQPDGASLTLASEAGVLPAGGDPKDIPLGTGWVGRVALEPGDRFVTSTPPETLSVWARENQVHCFCAFPIRLESRLLGIFGLCFHEQPAPTFLDAVEQSAAVLGHIIARIRTGRELAQTVQHLSAIIENEPECVKVMSLDGRILDMNRAGLRIVKAPTLEMLRNADAIQLVHPDDRDRFAEHHGKICEGATGHVEFRLITFEGSLRVLNSTSTPLRNADGEITAVLSVTRDVTEQKEAEQERQALANALRQSEERYRLAMEGSAAGLWDWPDCGLGVYYWSPHLLGLLGYENTASLPSGPPDAVIAQFVHSGEQAHVHAALHRHLKGLAPFDVEVRLRCNGGAFRWFRLRGQAVFDGQNNPLRMAGSMQDIHSRILAEQEVHHLNLVLEQRVRLRTEELLAANRELESFSYSVSHDLRAPLRAIEGFSLALEEDYAHQFDAAATDYVRRIRGATTRMTALIDDLLSLSHYTRVQPRTANVHLSAVAQAICSELMAGAGTRQVRFDVAAGIIATCDADLLRIVLSNLLGNAFKFTSHKDVAQIEFGEHLDDGLRVFFVSDNGAGFDMAYKDRLFQPFQRLHSQSEFPGTGIGLATAHRIISRHGGRIWADSVLGRGANFYFTLA